MNRPSPLSLPDTRVLSEVASAANGGTALPATVPTADAPQYLSPESARDSVLSRERVLRIYRRYAPVYDGLFGLVLDHGRRRLAATIAGLQARAVLEVGVGTGLTLRHYPSSIELTGIDLSGAMLEHARRRAAVLRDRSIRLLQMDAEALSFPDQSFDCVTLPYVLSVTPYPERLVGEVRRVCRRGGSIVVLNHFSGDPRLRWAERLAQRIAGRTGFRSEFEFERHILAHDWCVESVHPVNLFGLSKLVVIRNT